MMLVSGDDGGGAGNDDDSQLIRPLNECDIDDVSAVALAGLCAERASKGSNRRSLSPVP